MGDLITVKKMKFVNESGEYVADPDQQKNYMYDYFLQINLAAINRKEEDLNHIGAINQ